MDTESEIEKLRAAIIVDRSLMQAILEEVPQDIFENIRINATSKLEQFSIKALYSTMPESFVKNLRESSDAWKGVFEEIAVRRGTQQKLGEHRE